MNSIEQEKLKEALETISRYRKIFEEPVSRDCIIACNGVHMASITKKKSMTIADAIRIYHEFPISRMPITIAFNGNTGSYL